MEKSNSISKSSKGFVYRSKQDMENAQSDFERFYANKSKWDSFENLDLMDALTVRYFGKSTAKKNPAKLSNHVETMEFKPKKKFNLEDTKKLITRLKSVVGKEPSDGLDLTDVMEDYTFSLIKGLLTVNSLGFSLKDQKVILMCCEFSFHNNIKHFLCSLSVRNPRPVA